jgi:hypothetical protein
MASIFFMENFLVLNLNSNKLLWLTSPKFQHHKNEKKMEGFHLHQKILFHMNIYWFSFIIWSLWPFIKAFCILTWTRGSSNMSKYWQGNSLGTWNDEMYAPTYSLSMCTRKITILMQIAKIHEILIVFNEKPNITQISKVITLDMFH